MSRLLEGVRVVEVSMWGFVPTTGVVLADWGADVIKLEHPVYGDPARGVVTSTWVAGKNGVKFVFEIFNRGKRCIGVDLTHPDGRAVLDRLLAETDVFVTSLRPSARQRMGIDAARIRARFPGIVYASGSGVGPEGPEANVGGMDLSAYWTRTGLAYCMTTEGARLPADMPAPGSGDVPSGTILAGGIAAALYRKARTGEGATIDLSLLNAGMWSIEAELTGTDAIEADRFYKGDGRISGNPLVAAYRTADGRFIQLVMTDGDRHWADLCRRLGRPELTEDARFADQAARHAHAGECIMLLEEAFGSQPVAHWRAALDGASGVWAVAQTPREVPSDPQVVANGYVRRRQDAEGRDYLAVSSPVRDLDNPDPGTRPAPGHGEQTDEVLLDLGFTWDELIKLKIDGAIV